jgi:DNA-binding response OmpR family regulator
MNQTERILIIEDDSKIVELVEIHLKDLGFQVDQASDGNSGLHLALGEKYKLIILDLMLPELDGIEVCKHIRQNSITTPILMLTAKSEELDKVLGLEIGADDYMTKPFSIREFVARVKSIMRRIDMEHKEIEKSNTQDSRLNIGFLKIDFDQHRVWIRDREVELTAKEFDLLALFARHPNRIYNRETLLDLVWGYKYNGYEHTVNSHINRLRNKIEKDPTNPEYIKTLWGVGYRFELPEEDEN